MAQCYTCTGIFSRWNIVQTLRIKLVLFVHFQLYGGGTRNWNKGTKWNKTPEPEVEQREQGRGATFHLGNSKKARRGAAFQAKWNKWNKGNKTY
jgi:hypothetical protein